VYGGEEATAFITPQSKKEVLRGGTLGLLIHKWVSSTRDSQLLMGLKGKTSRANQPGTGSSERKRKKERLG